MRAKIVGSLLLLLLGGCSSGGAASGSSDGGDSGNAGEAQLVELPKGSREVDGIVNLIDADAAHDLDDFLAFGMAELTRPLNLFLTHYEERYDFVFIFSEHDLPGVGAGEGSCPSPPSLESAREPFLDISHRAFGPTVVSKAP